MLNWIKKKLTGSDALASSQRAEPTRRTASTSDEPTDIETLQKRGNALLAEGRWEEAIQCYRHAFDLDPQSVSATISLGYALAAQGHGEEAEHYLSLAVRIDPGNADAYYMLGGVANARGDLSTAIEYFRKALECKPDFEFACRDLYDAFMRSGHDEQANIMLVNAVAAHPEWSELEILLADLYREKGEHEAAAEHYRKFLSAQPSNLKALCNLGLSLQISGKLKEAADSFKRMLALKPDCAEAYYNLGNVIKAQGDAQAAIEYYEKSLELNPDDTFALTNLGNTHMAQGDSDAAFACYKKILAVSPNDVSAHNNAGLALRAQGSIEAALEYFNKALALEPLRFDTHANIAHILQAQGKFEAAIEHYRRAISLAPESSLADLHLRVGNVFLEQENTQKAIESYQGILAIKPDFAKAYSNIGTALLKQGNYHAALEYYRKALALKPDLSEVGWNESLTCLLLGDYGLGWKKYESRWNHPQLKQSRRHYKQPLWLGDEPLEGKTILLHSEQGFGDTIQFCRYARLVSERGAKVLMQVQAPVKRLLSSLDGIHDIFSEDDLLPLFDYQCPLMSLPLALRTTPETIPAFDTYLKAEPDLIASWDARLGKRQKPRIGLAWSGRPTFGNDRNRSIPFPQIAKIVSDRAQFISIQKDVRETDLAALNACSNVAQFGEHIRDFSDTAALVANLDLIVTVDTSVAHLAGALGKPVWILLPFVPDWRWFLERSDSPWYPSATLFRQPDAGNWAAVFERVESELERLF